MAAVTPSGADCVPTSFSVPSAEFAGVVVSAEEDTTMTIESEGECLWDVESGRLVSLRFTTETTIDSASVESAESDEGTYGMEYSSVVRMESNVEVTVESR